MPELIELNGLSKQFGPILAVDNVSFRVGRGQVLGFLGPNGAGKSTTMKMVSGFLEPSAGSVRIDGFDMAVSPVEGKRRIGYLPEGAPTYGDMTPSSFLNFIAEVRGFDGAEKARRVAEVVERVHLKAVLNQAIDTLSKGYKRRVGLAQAMVHDPEILLLDEPTDGLDPNQKHHVRSLIQEMAADKAIIVSTHILEEVEAVCTRALIIDRGRIVADGTPEGLLARDPNFNSVIIRVARDHLAQVQAGFEEICSVNPVASCGGVGGNNLLRLASDGDPSLITRVNDHIRQKKFLVEEVYVEKATLDQVFRHITSDTDDQKVANA